MKSFFERWPKPPLDISLGGAKMPLTGIEGLEGCSQWNFMPRSDLR